MKSFAAAAAPLAVIDAATAFTFSVVAPKVVWRRSLAARCLALGDGTSNVLISYLTPLCDAGSRA